VEGVFLSWVAKFDPSVPMTLSDLQRQSTVASGFKCDCSYSNAAVDKPSAARCFGSIKPRLHDTTGCQSGCTTGLTTVLNEQLFVQPVVKPCLTNRFDNGFDNRLYCVNGALLSLTVCTIVRFALCNLCKTLFNSGLNS